MLDYIIEGINWIIDFFCAPVYSFFETLYSYLPTLHMELDTVASYFSIANKFVAIDLAFTLFVAWFLIVTARIVICWILGLIPTLN